MALNFTSQFLLSHPYSPFLSHHHQKSMFLLFLRNNLEPSSSSSRTLWNYSAISSTVRASISDIRNGVSGEEEGDNSVLDDELIGRASSLKEASEVLQLIADNGSNNGGSGGVVNCEDCCRIISAALLCYNSDLALSIFAAMRSSAFDQVFKENGGLVARWKWSRPDVNTYTTLVIGLAASLRVSDALKIIEEICQVGLSHGEEVPFGKIIRCPTCTVAVAVAQPQQGIQVVSCAKCRYQYELVSGDIVNIESEEISMDVPAWRRWLGFLQITKQTIPSAVHSIVIQTPSGAARTHRFATSTPDVPAQPGERVTIALAAPSSVFREVGPFRISPKAPKYYPSEPLCLTNHRDSRESLLLRAPSANSKASLLNPSIVLPLLVLLASGDAASGYINPSLPQLLPVAAAASLAVGATLNTVVLPQLGQLPQRTADAISIKQQLLAQYDMLQSRIKDLKDTAEKEVWMLARICQLENKIFAVGEPSYRARRTRVKKVREGLENSLRGRMGLIDSYARISSMIEIEVELDTDVLAAEASSNTENIAKQIEQIMELENLEERWRQQAEANDEVEMLLSSESLSSEQV
ncbi:hypothetical protein SOVF_054710 [Spinacia oleracea]|uniref:Pentatricopeptide repeat-containing protein n=1 Tax=Spinacia oleracea TaxID=3562 RepID=A0A9R0ICK9_SPIOL|nr:uncharacterized protein LOC110786405 [Spinacia oleracea]KNA20195.1 hypothetical protein SOVF_054710 [Spinacia oleracea]